MKQHQLRNLLLSMLCVITFSPAWAQEKVTLSGTIKDGTTGEDLIGAAVVIPSMPGTGAITNVYGFYSLTIPAGTYTVRYQYLGYEAQEIEMDLSQDQRKAIELMPAIEQLEEVVVTSERLDQNVTSVDMGLTKLDPAQVANIPVLFGEQDIFKTIQLLPGIQSAGEGGSGFFVRGGSADQNLILIDEANVYNASHLLGFFSVFNSDAIRDLQIYKGLMPAQYGGRLSSVLDVKMKEGNNKKFGAQGGVGLISSRLTVEGPIVKDKASFMASGRRTYADLFIPLANNEDLDGTQLFFYDLNMKANALINENNRVYLSGYFGRDVFAFAENFGFNWGNATGTLRWNTVINDKLFLNSSAIFTNYDYEIGFGDLLTITSGLRDWQLKEDFFWYPNENNTVQFGATAIHHTFKPTELAAPEGGPFNDSDLMDRFALETGAYIQNDQKIGDKLNVRYGIRLSNFNSIGPATYFTYDGGAVADSIVLGSGEFGNPYFGWEPRLGFSYL
ncbi:MAG: TonB-dependent receptor, partial [Bacteroidota bacterium]